VSITPGEHQWQVHEMDITQHLIGVLFGPGWVGARAFCAGCCVADYGELPGCSLLAVGAAAGGGLGGEAGSSRRFQQKGKLPLLLARHYASSAAQDAFVIFFHVVFPTTSLTPMTHKGGQHIPAQLAM
jgi:hypothetical protein